MTPRKFEAAVVGEVEIESCPFHDHGHLIVRDEDGEVFLEVDADFLDALAAKATEVAAFIRKRAAAPGAIHQPAQGSA